MTKHNESDTKERLLTAAIKIFAEKGFMASTVREICHEADVNVAAVNYHFGDKEQLYGTVLQLIFEQYATNRNPDLAAIAASDAPVEERLRAHILVGVLQTYDKDCEGCGKCPGKNENKHDGCAPYAVFLMEMAHPSPHLDAVVEDYIKPDAIELSGILRDYFGPAASDETIKRCSDSIWGQILHRALCWPIEDRLSEEDTSELDVHALAEHICNFTMGGLQLIKQQLDNKSE